MAADGEGERSWGCTVEFGLTHLLPQDMAWMNISAQPGIFLVNFIAFTALEAEQPFLPNKALPLRTLLKLSVLVN
jgi:hypothetical protein